MNIKEAKDEIKNTIIAYLTKDEFGNYEIPIEKQRPIILMGPPGVGKTAIMEQIASEMSIPLVSYSMTHHTRQSALGLPFINKKIYGGKEYSVSEYTMSEIIASVYEMIELSNISNGILFLDEINCVSETLAPAMLKFLQYKVFGSYQVPNGWIIVTAGNPPEYNNSVREYDIVTWDRLKRIDIEADFEVWKEYAYKKQVHASIITYLEIYKADFYSIETTVDGKEFVTARGWSDLSDMIKLYEKNNIPVSYKLIAQYLHKNKIAHNYANYYELYNKYKSDYPIEDILNGTISIIVKNRVRDAKFDERIMLMGMIIDKITEETITLYYEEKTISLMAEIIGKIKQSIIGNSGAIYDAINEQIALIKKEIEIGIEASSMTKDNQYTINKTISLLYEVEIRLHKSNAKEEDELMNEIKKFYMEKRQMLLKKSKKVGERLNNVFLFTEEIFSNGDEMILLITELTLNYYCSQFISQYGSEKYYQHSKELSFSERHKGLLKEIEKINNEYN